MVSHNHFVHYFVQKFFTHLFLVEIELHWFGVDVNGKRMIVHRLSFVSTFSRQCNRYR